MTETLRSQLEFLAIADGMKQVFRQSPLIDGSRRENSAEHSWHFALAAMTLFRHCALEGVDLGRVLKMAVLHDLVEIYSGDAPAHDKAANIGKEEREREAADRLFSMLPKEQAGEFRSLWDEFEAMLTPTAIYANAVDRFQSFFNIHTNGKCDAWRKFGATAESARARQLPLKTAIPALWQWTQDAIEENVRKGNLVQFE